MYLSVYAESGDRVSITSAGNPVDGQTVKKPISDRSDGDSAGKYVLLSLVFDERHGSHVATITPSPDAGVLPVNERKSFLESPVVRASLDRLTLPAASYLVT